ncbi:hypothetical protein Pdw03_6155 [Penicillium digitatum]|uniref:Uncharacterized protein n=1 Tax=Penicillium digitatum TaxID=36651 RepID=A0A7T6XJH4_PENDI|nr:hypothetical protein Pdw03_6155 [Penicillium digitatum]
MRIVSEPASFKETSQLIQFCNFFWSQKTHLFPPTCVMDCDAIEESASNSKDLLRYPRITSLSALSSPTIQSVIARFTHSAFHPVTGCTQTTECSRST